MKLNRINKLGLGLLSIALLALILLTMPNSENNHQLADPIIYTSNTIDSIETAEESETVKLWKNVKFEPINNYEFNMQHGEKLINCSYMQKSRNRTDNFHSEVFNCIEMSPDGERIIDYGLFVLNEVHSNNQMKVFTYIDDDSYGFQFNEIEHFIKFKENIGLNRNSYDGFYTQPQTSEGSVYAYSGILDNIYKDDLTISNNTFSLNPELTLYDTELRARLGSAAEMFTQSKKAGWGVGCIAGAIVGGLTGIIVDYAAAGATLSIGSVAMQGATAGCFYGGSVGYMKTPEYDRRIYCAVYNGINNKDYVVCQEWWREVKDRSSAFSGDLIMPLIGSLRILSDPDHIEINFPDRNQKVSFLITKKG